MDHDEIPPVSPGQLWQATDVAGILYVADTVIEGPIIAAHPVSIEIEYLSGEDLRLEAYETPIGLPVMIEAWHSLPVDRAALGRCLGQVSDEVFMVIQRFRAEVAIRAADRAASSGMDLPSEPGRPIVAFWRREIEYWKPAGARALALMLSEDAGEEQAAAVDAPRGFADLTAGDPRKGSAS